MNLILDFKSPVVIGGKRLTSNFIESDDIIRGNVVRASFAKIILDNCVEKDNFSYEKKNWVYFRNGKGCTNCNYSEVCKKFSNMKFTNFYPLDSEVIPLSSVVCKENDEHGFKDILVDSTENGCDFKIEKNLDNGEKEMSLCESRYEFTSGLRTSKGKNKKVYKVGKSITTKTQINPYSKTSSDGRLYSIVAVSYTNKEDGENKIVYSGTIEGIENKDIEIFKELRVGAYISVGYGKCNLLKDERSKRISTLEEVKTFSENYKGKEDGKNYIALKLIGDCKLNFPSDLERYRETDELRKMWEEALEISTDINVDKVYGEMISYRGYDNSKDSKDKREEASLMVKNGSVIVCSSSNLKIEEVFNYFTDIKGFGHEQENGFGLFDIYIGR